MNNRLKTFAKLAAQGMRRNARLFLPFLLAIVGTAAGLYIVAALALEPGLEGTRLALQRLQEMMILGLVVIGFFVLVFLFYANSFLFKRRKKELALYQILGMRRRDIAGILAFEALYTALAGVGAGLLAGIALFKLAQLAMCRLTRFDVVFGLGLSVPALLFTAAFFGGAMLLMLALNLLHIRRVKPVELLQGAQAGEREPKTRWLLTLLGVGTLGAGYYLALRSRDAMQALGQYFPAVILVIVGTYCLFTSVSIAALKLLRRRKGFYYRPNHFISVSGMLYRMKQNAVGMANICILSTMVMVMVSGTVSLYAGTEEMLDLHDPADYMVTVTLADDAEKIPDFSALRAALADKLAEGGIGVTRMGGGVGVSFSAGVAGDGYTLVFDAAHRVANLHVLTAAAYGDLLGVDPPAVSGQDVLLYGGDPSAENLTLFVPIGSELTTVRLNVAGRVDEFPKLSTMFMLDAEDVGVVVADDAALWRLYALQRAGYGGNASHLRWEGLIDVDADAQTQIKQQYDLYEIGLESLLDVSYHSLRVRSRAEERADAYSMNGSFLFLGLFLGLVLLIATVLIIYYKQVSEGYDDKARFEILGKVGLNRREARRTINHQILMVFFLPLLVAGLHILLDFRMLSQLLGLFSVTNTRLAALCSLITFAAFSLVYGAVYALTARVYYRIVEG